MAISKEMQRVRRELGLRRGEVTLLIRHELRKLGYRTDTEFAKDVLKCSNASLSYTLRGKNHSPKVLDALRAAGVSEEYLFDPRRHEARMREAV